MKIISSVRKNNSVKLPFIDLLLVYVRCNELVFKKVKAIFVNGKVALFLFIYTNSRIRFLWTLFDVINGCYSIRYYVFSYLIISSHGYFVF